MDVNPNNAVADDTPEQRRRPNNLGTAIFLLNNLPLDNRSVDAPPHQFERNPGHPGYMPLLAATYFRPLQQILSSTLNSCGFLRAIYINFGFDDYYKLDPLVTFPTTVRAFEALLHRLLRGLPIVDPRFHNERWTKINDLRSLISELPGGEDDDPTGIIGCSYGPVTQDCNEIETYMNDAPDSEKFLLVVGRIDGEDIERHIDAYVRVARHDMYGDLCLRRILRTMENKWCS